MPGALSLCASAGYESYEFNIGAEPPALRRIMPTAGSEQ
jgi:hypothetical protein